MYEKQGLGNLISVVSHLGADVRGDTQQKEIICSKANETGHNPLLLGKHRHKATQIELFLLNHLKNW